MNDPDPTGVYTPGTTPDGNPAAPARVGRYRVERLLGRGGFGLVYLARDEQLHRLVAVKVPHPSRLAGPDAAAAYLAEARTAARLDHPHIVPVYDVGVTPDYPCFIVSKYIDGTDLAARLKAARLSVREAAELVATVAEALHAAHRQGLVHRDVKPGNILLDAAGRPFVADFGLALRDRDAGKGPRYAGTPAYMSPEQARGEGHRVDGRSDVFSLGVVFYELLSGRQPFRGDSETELMERITGFEPRPPRQYDETIPKELERVCLKALAKRAAERYSTAKDLADDLRHFLAECPDAARPVPPPAEHLAPPSTVAAPPATTPDSRPARVVPKGLRSFDARDADFFLELLPGPRDRDGLPDAVRFWKARVEEPDPDQTFPVGLIYGPSGCGKSSLVKAGVLPRLASHVTAVYVEATAEDTEARLLNGLRKHCPAAPPGRGLKETVAALRLGDGLPPGRKVVLVIDQFEQWLHASQGSPNDELVQALRQCDGGRVQGVVMVRDDFWMAATRFMRGVEVRILEGQNSAAVDLFPVAHAGRVLEAFGRAFGVLPDGPLGKDHAEFVARAAAGLAQDGNVVCVRLALFAEMVKGKAWTPRTLAEVGGTAGVGVAFLDDTFAAATAPPEHRYHQKAARAVLGALLPEAGANIKGHMRSREQLLAASGYAARPRDFDDLVRVLDGEVRLITPTDPDGKDDAGPAAPAGAKFYQLTHDYLVPSLRDWLTRKQRETRRGRAELLLADRAAVWAARPENRQLPSAAEWLTARWLTRRGSRTPPERAMMRAAGRYHLRRAAVLAACAAALGFVAWEANGRFQARALRDRLLEAATPEVPAVVKEMTPYRRWVDPLVRDAAARAADQNDARKQLRASLALLPADAAQVGDLRERLLTGDADEVRVIRDALAAHKDDLAEPLWAVLESPQSDPARRLRAGCALASFAPDDRRWADAGGELAAILVVQKPFEIARWTDSLSGAGRWLTPALAAFLVDEARTVPERGLIAGVYGAFAADSPDAFARLEAGLAAGPDDTPERAKTRASVGVALLVMGRGEKAWPLLKHAPDPTVRSYLIARLAAGGVEPKALLSRLTDEADPSARRALVLCLGEYGLDRVSPAERRNHLPRLLALYRDDLDPGVHSAADWVLRRWGAADELKAADAPLATGKAEGGRGWYLNRHGHTMAVVPAPGEVEMGDGADRHRRRIDRPFAVAAAEVTVGQFLRFRPRHAYNTWFARTPDSPAARVTWYDAAAYCNWLSDREGIPKDQWCYTPNKDGLYAEGVAEAPGALARTGYRLPADAEWEFACRAGATTAYSFGGPVELLGRYGWFDGTALGISHPVGEARPNDLGLFDMHGNAWEWCHDAFTPHPKAGDPTPPRVTTGRVLRGGSFNNPPSLTRTASRNDFPPATQDDGVGFRVARTVTP